MTKMQANFVLIFVTVIWGGGFIATDSALKTFSPFYVMAIRFLGAAIVPIILSRQDLKKLSAEHIRMGIITGALLFLAFALQTFGLQSSTPSKNAFLTATYVVFVPYLLWLFEKRKPNRKSLLAALLCLLGIALLTWKGDMLSLQLGDILSLICAFFFAMHIIALEHYSSHISTVAFTAMQMLTSGVLSIICALCFEHAPRVVSSTAVMSCLYLIFISTLLAYLLQTAAQKYTSANSAALILSMEALFASVFSFLLLHEVMSFKMIAGAVLILFSIVLMEYVPKKKCL